MFRWSRGTCVVLLSLLLLLPLSANILASHPLAGGDDDQGDAGDRPDEAREVDTGRHWGSLNVVDDRADYYRIEVPAGRGLVVSHWAAAEHMMLFVEGRAADGRAYTHDAVYGYGEHYFGTDGDSTFILGIWASYELDEAAFPKQYAFLLDIVDLPGQDDAGSGVDAGSRAASAVVVAEGDHGATIGGFDDRDVFRIDAVAGRQYTATVTTQLVHVHARLGGGPTAIDVEDPHRPFSWTAASDGPVYLEVRAYQLNEYVEDYSFRISSSDAGPLPNLVVEGLVTVESDAVPESDCGGALGDRALQVEVTVRNAGPGSAAASEASVDFTSNGLQSYGCLLLEGVPALGPGEAFTFSRTFALDGTAQHLRVRAEADRRFSVQETDEYDNQRTASHETLLGGLLP